MVTPRFQDLDGKLAIVTGASRGIGAAIAHNLASRGCDLILTHSTPTTAPDCASVVASILALHPALKVLPICADVSTITFTTPILAAAAGRQIDILIHNAGVTSLYFLGNITPEMFEYDYSVNVRGPLLLTQAVLPWLPNDRSGRIVCVSSISSSSGLKGQCVYGGSKGALEAMARSWASELAERATVNSINPGPVDTRMFNSLPEDLQEQVRPLLELTPLAQLSEAEKAGEYKDRVEFYAKKGGRWGTAEEVANVVGMLCSREAAYCTGQVVCANGGMIFGK